MPEKAKDWMRAMTGMATRAFRGAIRIGVTGHPI
jgi:hypothetical protein